MHQLVYQYSGFCLKYGQHIEHKRNIHVPEKNTQCQCRFD